MGETVFRFREAVSEDASKIIQFVGSDNKNLKEGVFAVLNDPSKGRYYIGETEDQFLGFAFIFTEWSDWRNLNVWWISEAAYLKTLPSSFPKALMNFVISEAKKEDASILYIYDKPQTQCLLPICADVGFSSHYDVYEQKLL